MLFMGLGRLETKHFDDQPDPLDWTLRDTHASFYTYYKDMIHARRELPALAGARVRLLISILRMERRYRLSSMGYRWR